MHHTYIDQMGRSLNLPGTPRRIVSLVPSQTELLADLNLEKEVVGITKFCVHPAKWYKNKSRIGGTKSVHLDRIRALRPDLIIGNKEENDREMIRELEREFPVWMSEVYNLDDALQMIRMLGEICDRSAKAGIMASEISSRMKEVPEFPPLRTLYCIWQRPLMAVGNNTFIHAILELLGLENVMKGIDRYPEISEGTLMDLAPELILLPSEPFPFKPKHVEAFQKLCPDAVIKLVDGELFSWYGSRLLQAPSYFKDLRKQITI